MNNQISLLALFELGGIFMWPLLVFSIITLAIIAERTVWMLTHKRRINDISARVSSYLACGQQRDAQTWLESHSEKHLAAPVFASLLQHADMGEYRMEKAVEAEAAHQIGKMEAGFNFLVALGSLAPLTGFLGTVSGMIGAFKAIAEATEVNAKIVANGIYEALITTVFGLIIAIIAIVGHNILSHLVDTFSAGLEKSSSDLIVDLARSRQKNAPIAKEAEA